MLFQPFFERESFMPASTVSPSSVGLLRPAIAAAALMACSLAAQAADPVTSVVAPVTNAVTGVAASVNGKTTVNGRVNTAADTNVNANVSADAKADMNASNNGKAVSDAWITTKVKSEIVTNSVTKDLKVQVTTKGGVVALKGKLPTQEALDTVKSLAVNVKGVQSVDTSALVVTGG
jgi:hypothetical protein